MASLVGQRRVLGLALAMALTLVVALVVPLAASSQAQGTEFPLGGFPYLFPTYTYSDSSAPADGPPRMSLGPWPLPAPLSPQPPGANLQLRQLAALSRADVSRAVSLFTDDAGYSFSDGVGVCAAAPCTGKEAIRAEMQRQANLNTRFAPLSITVTGSTVTGLWDIRSDRVRSAGVQRILGTITSEVRGDHLAFDRIVLVRDDPQTATFITWLQIQPPAAPAPTPATASGAPGAPEGSGAAAE